MKLASVAGSVVLLAVLAASTWFAAKSLYSRGLLRFNYPSHTRYPIRGIDVSHHQGKVDWTATATENIHFAFIKASEGADHLDREFDANWDGAAAAGIARGAYHFFTFCTPGDLQAGHFHNVAGDGDGELPHAVDVEFSGNCKNWTSIDSIRAELRIFLERTELNDGRRPILYAPRDAYAQILAGHFDEYPLWLRDLLAEPGHGSWQFWQYADNGRVAGFATLVDLNVFRGTPAEFSELVAHARPQPASAP